MAAGVLSMWVLRCRARWKRAPRLGLRRFHGEAVREPPAAGRDELHAEAQVVADFKILRHVEEAGRADGDRSLRRNVPGRLVVVQIAPGALKPAARVGQMTIEPHDR